MAELGRGWCLRRVWSHRRAWRSNLKEDNEADFSLFTESSSQTRSTNGRKQRGVCLEFSSWEMEIAAVVWGSRGSPAAAREGAAGCVRGCRQQLAADATEEEGPEEGLEGRLGLLEAGVRKQFSSSLRRNADERRFCYKWFWGTGATVTDAAWGLRGRVAEAAPRAAACGTRRGAGTGTRQSRGWGHGLCSPSQCLSCVLPWQVGLG